MCTTPRILYSQQYGLGELSRTTGVDKWALLSKQVDPKLSATHHTANQPNIWVGTASGNYCLFLVATDSFEYTALRTAQLDCGLQTTQTLPATCSEMLMHSYKIFPANTGRVTGVARNHVSVLKVWHPPCVRSIIQSCSVYIYIYIYIYIYTVMKHNNYI